MEKYVGEYNYSNCFWLKQELLYSHSENKFKEYQSIGLIFKTFSNEIKKIYESLPKISKLYKPADEESTLNNGVEILFKIMNQMADSFKNLYNDIIKLSKNIEDKKVSFESKNEVRDLCKKSRAKYIEDIEILKKQQKEYYDSINKVIESFLASNLKNNLKFKEKLEYNLKAIEVAKTKREEYKNQIDIVRKNREEYMDFQGNIFASEEEFERECTNELKEYLLEFINIIKNFKIKIELNEEEMKTVNEIDGNIDIKTFAEKNKSLASLKRYTFEEYSQNFSYYITNFNCLKNKLKNKTPEQIKEVQNKLSDNITILLNAIAEEKYDKEYIEHSDVLNIAKKLTENKLTEEDFNNLILIFQKRYDQFLKWKEEKVLDQNYRKVGIQWEDRFCYMYTFLKYFNDIRVSNKELNEINYNYLCEIMKKILEFNNNDIDYSLCDLIIILSFTFYMVDSNYKDGKKYLNEDIKTCEILQKPGFWVGYVEFEINEEIKNKSKLENRDSVQSIKDGNFKEAKLDTNSVNFKLITILYDVTQFISDTNLINQVIYDIFKYCEIKKDDRAMIIEMVEQQMESDNKIVLDKNFLLN